MKEKRKSRNLKSDIEERRTRGRRRRRDGGRGEGGYKVETGQQRKCKTSIAKAEIVAFKEEDRRLECHRIQD